jgi:hypothetical protein
VKRSVAATPSVMIGIMTARFDISLLTPEV